MLQMVTFEEALEIVIRETPCLTFETVPLIDAVGRVSAADVSSDVDMPPFRKSMMDGFAVRVADLGDAPRELTVVATIRAGEWRDTVVGEGDAAAVMTGAPIPDGADAVVMVEKTSGFGAPRVTIDACPRVGDHISEKGEILRRGDIVLKRGRFIGPEEAALLAMVGCDPVAVHRRPSVAVMTTGDELVSPREVPGPGQIRDTNGVALAAFLKERGITPVSFSCVKDDAAAIARAIDAGLDADVLFISGGVSMGAFDFVEEALTSLGVTRHFGKVAVKPGKPTVFGTLTRGGKKRLVLGLPGNPVSAAVIARLLGGAVLDKLQGAASIGPKTISALLAKPIRKKPDRLWFILAQLEIDIETRVLPVENRGSADLLAAASSDCYIIAPKGVSTLDAGEPVSVVVWERSRC